MKDIDYAFCVAKIRANESSLLTADFVNKLIDTADYNEAVKMLTECGWISGGDRLSDYINDQNSALWQLLSESVPDKKELDALLVVNDFFNIKTAVKCALLGENPETYFIQPTSVDAVDVYNKIRLHDFSSLPAGISECAEQAYNAADKTENGQIAEIIIDRAALEIMLRQSKKHSDKVFSAVCSFLTDTYNMKTALRCAATNKASDFARAAISGCVRLDSEKLIDLCTGDKNALHEYLAGSDYSEGYEIYLKSPSGFDKWCDDKIIDIVKRAKFTSFGFAPVCAYYYAKINEIKTVRIILTGKLSSVSADIVKERVRALYV